MSYDLKAAVHADVYRDNRRIEDWFSRYVSRSEDEIIADLKSDIVRTKERSLEPINSELKVETGNLNQVKQNQQELMISSIILALAVLFLLAIFFQKIRLKYINFRPQNIDKKRLNIILLVWSLFHFFILITSNRKISSPISWKWRDFWILADWESYPFFYDLSEFVIYAVLPALFIFGRRYLRGEKLV